LVLLWALLDSINKEDEIVVKDMDTAMRAALTFSLQGGRSKMVIRWESSQQRRKQLQQAIASGAKRSK